MPSETTREKAIEAAARAMLLKRIGPSPFPDHMLQAMPLEMFGGHQTAIEEATTAYDAIMEVLDLVPIPYVDMGNPEQVKRLGVIPWELYRCDK